MKKKTTTVLRTQYHHVLHVFNTVLVVIMVLSFLSDFSMLIKQKILPKTIEVFLGDTNNFITKYFVYCTMSELIIVYFVVYFLLRKKKSWRDIMFLLFIFFLSFRTPFRLLNAIIGAHAKNQPIDDADKYFPQHVLLEQNFHQIQEEILTFTQHSNSLTCFGDILQGVNYIDTNNNNQKCWKWFTILDYHGFSEEACRELPFLTRMIKQMPEVLSASISLLEGKSDLLEHRGYYKGFMRYHLGILVPTDHPPVLTVADKKYHWKEGEGVIFDDMHVHSVSNPSSYPRIVLFLDILRNDLPPAIDALNRWTISFLQGFIAEADAQDHANLKVGKK